jgi:hypothetical protein
MLGGEINMDNKRGGNRRNVHHGVRKAVEKAGQAPKRPVTGKKPITKSPGVINRRIKPSTRAQTRQDKINQRPMPKPPVRRKPVALAASAQSGNREQNQEVQLAVTQLHARFENLETEAQLSDVYNAIGSIDAKLTELPFILEALRARGYVHSGQLEDQLEAIDDRWDEIRPRVETALRSQVSRMDAELDMAEKQINQLRPVNLAAVQRVETAVNGLDRRIDAARTAVVGLFDGMENELNQIAYELQKVTAMLDLVDGSQAIRLQEAEGPLLAVKGEWHQNGDEGPEGILFLTDQRILFEQREEIVTKKRFGIFKTDSEIVQKLLIDIPVPDIEEVNHKEEGGFLGMGKNDILELIFAASASVTRARFHLKGQDSSAWAALIKRIQTHGIDEDRADEYVEEVEVAEETAASFPQQCPTCFADVPTQTRGVTTYTCDFCGTLILPESQREQ